MHEKEICDVNRGGFASGIGIPLCSAPYFALCPGYGVFRYCETGGFVSASEMWMELQSQCYGGRSFYGTGTGGIWHLHWRDGGAAGVCMSAAGAGILSECLRNDGTGLRKCGSGV